MGPVPGDRDRRAIEIARSWASAGEPNRYLKEASRRRRNALPEDRVEISVTGMELARNQGLHAEEDKTRLSHWQAYRDLLAERVRVLSLSRDQPEARREVARLQLQGIELAVKAYQNYSKDIRKESKMTAARLRKTAPYHLRHFLA